MRFRILPLLFCAFSAFAAEPTYPTLTGRVVDGANLLAPDIRQKLKDKLKAHEDKTSDQVVVATVPSLQDVTIEDFANGLFRHWQLGQKAKNNGALLIVAPKERKVRIEVGYGLEGALTDALSKVIITTAIAPSSRPAISPGIEAGVDAILTILAGDAEEWQRRAEVRSDESTLGEDIAVVIAMIFIFLFVVAFLRGLSRQGGVRRHRLRNGQWVTLPQSTGWSTGSGSSSGWSGGGGGWSSGGGGFSGGGGSSGGGGASGDW